MAKKKTTSKSKSTIKSTTKSTNTTSTTTTTTSTASPGFNLASPDRPFDDILNFRDVGRSINDIYGSKCDSPSLSL